MKKFRDLLEKNNSSEDILRNIKYGNLPISPKFFDELFGVKDEIYFHSLSVKNIAKLIKLEGSKKTISVFTNWEGDVADTIAWGPVDGKYRDPIIAVLKGNYAIKMSTDIWSFIGADGRRWIDRFDIKEQDEKSTRLLSDICEDLYAYYIDELENITDKKTKIKMYFDKAYELLTKNKSKIIKAARDRVGKFGYNELLAHSFKIKEFINFNEDDEGLDDLINRYNRYKFIDVPEHNLNKYMKSLLK